MIRSRISPMFPAAVTSLTFAAAFAARADVVVPSSAFSSGRNNAEFHTDVRIFNPGTSPVLVTPVFYDQAAGGTVTKPAVTIPGRAQVAYDNVLSSLFGKSLGTFGPIRFQAASPLVVSASVNNVNACGNGAVSGQWLPGIDVSAAAKQGNLVQLALSASDATGYRTNVVFYNPGTAVASVTATLRKGDGSQLSSLVLEPLGADGWKQLSLAGDFPGAAGVTDTNVFLEFRSDQPVLSFASVINNGSGDPFAIVSQSDPTVPPAAPSASFSTSPASPAPGQAVTFTDTSTGSPTTQLWAFGDGGVAAVSGATTTHTYATAGTYHVAHFVTNAAGASGSGKDVVVASAGATPVAIQARQWEYTPSSVTLHVGTTYQITWSSQDVIHGVGGVPELGITSCNLITTTVPCTVTFTPTASMVGTHTYACTQTSCGAGHNSMKGSFVIVSP